MGDKRFPGDGVVTGHGLIDGRPVYVFSQDFTVFGGSLGEAHAQKICKIMDMAVKVGVPVIGLNDSGGARIQEGVVSLGGYADIFLRNTLASGVVPQISAIMGPCAGGAVYSPAITDFIFMVEDTSYMFVTGPNVVKTVTHEEVTSEELGGAMTHASKSGWPTSRPARTWSAWPSSASSWDSFPPTTWRIRRGRPARIPSIGMKIASTRSYPKIPTNPTTSRRSFASWWTKGISSRSTSITPETSWWASPASRGGPWESSATSPRSWPGPSTSTPRSRGPVSCASATPSTSHSLPSRMCPGFLPGTVQEYGGIIKHGAKLLYAYCEATVPKITVILRKAYGGAYDVMSSKHIRGDMNYAWPSAEIAVMGPKGAVEIIFRREIAEADDKEAMEAALIEEYKEKFANPYTAAERGYVDEVIEPAKTRESLITALRLLENKREKNPPKKHGNIPL